MNKVLLPIIMFISLFMGVTSCASLEEEFGPDTVFTTSDQVVTGGEFARVPIEQLPASISEALPPGKEIVLTSKEYLAEEATYVPLGGELTEKGTEGIVKTIFGIGSAFIPGLAAWEGIAMLLSKRKRKHYARAVKKATPHDGRIDLSEAAKSIAAALGISHSSKGTEAEFEHEEADELAKEKAKTTA